MGRMKQLPLKFDELSVEDLIWITDHMFGNVFVCNGEGKIIYLNQNAADTFGLTREEVLHLNTREITGRNIIDRSTTMEALINKETVIGNFKNNRTKKEYFAISSPMLDEQGEVSLVMTYSQEQALMTTFIELIEKERKLTQKYKNAYQYIVKAGDVKQSIVGDSVVMQTIYQYALRIAGTDCTILIQGESGTGKDVLANYIHFNSVCSEEPFIPVNCSAIPGSLVESEFFGYEKGAFTGAKKEGKPGLFELANRGTLFLDEIGELPLEMQSKLLRVLETREFTRVGGTQPIKTQVRLISASNRNLRDMVKQKQFREDLYYRLNVVPIELPPLREHAEDIVPLAEHFLAELNRKYSLGRRFSEEVLAVFQQYEWPGNIRELRNVVERLVITSNNDILAIDTLAVSATLPRQNGAPKTAAAQQPLTPEADRPKSPAQSYKKLLRQKVIDALLESNGNKSMAAKTLGMSIGKLNRILAKNPG